ncbi:MAG: protein translocase subunit SecD [Candidatus Pacebacteria bacterium]|nr:protein translocase subunit SecD [Candidatus Paceibacterota bacterium]MCF7856905.1 protein translocase subunit SecD [Candidatus Paceibacterota bacterium]
MRVFRAIAVIVCAGILGYFVYASTIDENSSKPFKFGLDLAGGSHLVYEADVSSLEPSEVPELMNVLREVIERRINVFGVSEPVVQIERSSFVAETKQERLIVELPGVANVDEAIKEIGKTPLLEFKLIDKEAVTANASIEKAITDAAADGKEVDQSAFNTKDIYVNTELTGRYLKGAELVFGSGSGAGLSNEPTVSITFNDEGADLFEKITRENVGEQLAIFLDGTMMSSPRINEAIGGGKAIISGNFTPDEARELVRNLNFGALPVPITLESTQTIGSSLGDSALQAGVYAGVVGFIILSCFLILWYRLPGIIAVVALIIYVTIMLALFKLIPVVLTAAGIAGFILSVGLAVDANVLIAERMKEELLSGKRIDAAISEGFGRAWLAIRDSNTAHIIVGIILFWFGTALIKGFALVFSIGVFVSMFSAITVSRTLLLALPVTAENKLGKFLMGSGISH